jgi:hypothetical protein
MGVCGNSISGSKGDCVDIEVAPNGQIRASLKIKQYAAPGLANNLVFSKTTVPAALDPNVLVCSKDGASVLAGKTQTLILFKDFATGELKGDVVVAPAPNPNNPCDPTQPDRNVLQSTGDGLGVWTQGLPTGVTFDSAATCQSVFTYRDCSTGELRAYLLTAPEISNGNCSPTLDKKGNVVLRNALVCTDVGAAVWTGLDASGDIETYVDCDSHELRARLVIQEDLSCLGTGTNLRAKNALISTGTGAAVLTGMNGAGAVRTFVDCATKELWGEVIIKPDAPTANCSGTPKTNALRLTSEGLAVEVGANPNGCVETFVDCDTNKILGKLIISPNQENSLGSSVLTAQNGLYCTPDGAAVLFDDNTDGCVHLFVDPVSKTVKGRVKVKSQASTSNCDPATLTNALRCSADGLEVPFGDTNSLNMFVDCPSGQLRGDVRIDPDTLRFLEVGPAGLKIKLSAKDPSGSCANGLVVSSDGLSAPSTNCQLAGHAGKATFTTFNYTAGGANTQQASDYIEFTVHNNTCKSAAGLILFRAPSGKVTNSHPEQLTAKISYEGSYTVGSVTDPVGEVYVEDGFAMVYAFTGQTEYRQVTIAPGGSFTARMRVSATFETGPSTPSGSVAMILHSFSIDAILYNVDCTRPINE